MAFILHLSKRYMQLVGIEPSQVALFEDSFFYGRVSYLVSTPAWNGEFTHDAYCLIKLSMMCVSKATSAMRISSPMNMDIV